MLYTIINKLYNYHSSHQTIRKFNNAFVSSNIAALISYVKIILITVYA